MSRLGAGPRSLLVGGLLVAVVATGCTTNAPAASPGASGNGNVSPLANSDWLLGTLFGRPIPSGTTITLLFSVLQAGGFSGCNQFSMPYATEDTGLRFGPISGTRASCGSALDAVETSYYTNLGLVTHWDITGDTLTLTSGTAEKVLIYSRMAPASVEGPWTIVSANNGSGAVTTVPSGVGAAISFMPDGTVQGFGGCNNFNGGYTTGPNNKISIGPLMSQMKACGDPADTFEKDLLIALGNATKWDISSSGALELRDDGGALQVSATSAVL
jgi:heat shock protein HslJ